MSQSLVQVLQGVDKQVLIDGFNLPEEGQRKLESTLKSHLHSLVNIGCGEELLDVVEEVLFLQVVRMRDT